MTPASRSAHPLVPRSPAVLRGGALLGALLLATSCAGAGPAEKEKGAAPQAAESTPSSSPEPAKEPEVTLAFGGDVHFEGMLRRRLDADPKTAMGPVGSTLSDADIAMVNLETAVTEGGTQAPGKEFAFRAPATAFDALKGAGVDVVSVANNHGMDFGADGLADTFANADKAKFPVVGAGDDAAEAYAPHIIEANGAKVAFIGGTDVLDEHLAADWTAGEGKPGLASTKGEGLQTMVEAVKAAKKKADAVVVHLHWGAEMDHCPLPHAPDMAQQLVDAGATAVVGGHAHVVSPGGYLGDSYVDYGMGNFVFYNFNGPTAETGVLKLTLRGDKVVEDTWLPGTIEGGVPVLNKGDVAAKAETAWAERRATCNVNLTADPGGAAPEAGSPEESPAASPE